MRCIVKTPDRQLGFLELVDGATEVTVVQAIREHRLFVVPVDDGDVRLDDPVPGSGEVIPGGAPRPRGKSKR